MDWYYARNNERIGPVEEKELVKLLGAGEIQQNTLVWKEGMADWVQIGTLSEFSSLLQGSAGLPVPGLAVATGAGDLVTCAVSGRQYPRDQVLKIGNDYVSAENKAVYLQRMREGVGLGGAMEYAGFGNRFLALLVDWLILTIISLVIFIPAFFLLIGNLERLETFGIVLQLGLNLVSIGLIVVYQTIFIGRWGATPGKMICKLKVVRSDGSDLTYGRAFGRACAEILSYWSCYIGFIIAAFDDQKRALHDYICDTRVIYK